MVLEQPQEAPGLGDRLLGDVGDGVLLFAEVHMGIAFTAGQRRLGLAGLEFAPVARSDDHLDLRPANELVYHSSDLLEVLGWRHFVA